MGRLTIPVASLIQGVSQQAATVRLPGQCDLMDNAWVSPIDGLAKRHPIDHIAALDELDLGDALVHTINRSPDEQYVAVFGGEAGSEFARVFEASDGTEVPVFGPLSVGTPFAPDFSYLTSPSPFLPANRELKALTLVDYTLVLNRHKGVELTLDLTDPDPSESTGFIFVRAGQYSTKYSATLQLAGQDPVTFAVATWDGIALGDGAANTWDLTITAPGTAGTTWRFSSIDGVAAYTVQGGDTATDVAVGLRLAINALALVTATNVGPVVTIKGTDLGNGNLFKFVPSVRPATGGTFTLEQTDPGSRVVELASIETTDIAGALGDAIAADPRFAVDVVGSVIRVDAVPVTNSDEVWTLRITKKSLPTTQWEVAVLAQTATYTVQSGDTTTDIAEGLRAAIDALTSVSATRSGTTIRMVSTSEMSPAVTPGDGGEYVLAEVSDVGTTIGTFESFKVEDSRGNDAILPIWHSVDHIDQLPLVLSDGFAVRVDGGTEEVEDDFYVKFVSDNPGEFGKGHWEETVGFRVSNTLDAETMPHALIRRQDDMVGSVTGTPLAKYFEFGPVDWADRTVGDETTAPAPGIARIAIEDSLEGTPEPIADIFFFRNRLGFLQGQKVLLSEAGVYFNVWRTTVRDVVDSDPIDIRVPHHTAIRLSHAVAYNRTLILMSDRVNFLLDGEPLLTPATVQVSPILEYAHDPRADPVTIAAGVYFPTQRDRFTGVRQMIPAPNVDKTFEVEDVGIAVPQYVAGRAIQFAANDLEGALLTLADGDQSALYLLKTAVIGNARVQIAWGRWLLGDNARVLGMGFIDSRLYLVVARPDGTHLEAMDLVSGRTDDGALYLTHLDRRVQFDTGAYDSDADQTSWSLPYESDDDETYAVVTRSTTGNDGGTEIPIALINGNVVTVDGDHSEDKVWIGQLYEWRYRFSKVFLRTGDPQTGKQRIQANGRLQVAHGILHVTNTAFITVEVTPYLRSTLSKDYSSADGRHVVPGNLPLMTEEIRFGVYSRDPQIDLSSTSPLPVRVEAADFEIIYDTVGFRPTGG